jgi:hypothetical protein
MKVAELLTLPVGQRLHWAALGLNGIVTGRDGARMHVRLSDGVHIEVDPDDKDVVVLARCLERMDEPALGQPFAFDSWD